MVRLGQIGVGNWGKNLLRNFANLPDAELVAVSDISEEVLQKVGRQYPGVQLFSRAEELIDSPEVEAVVIATEPVTHFPLAKRALEQGKHVFVEKPMTLRPEESEELVALSDKAGKILMVGHLLEYHPAYLKVKEAVESGELGEVYYIYSTRVNLGVIRQNENALWSLAPHDISVALMLMKAEPERVVCTGQAFLQPGIEDVVFLNLHFADGRMAHMHVSWLDPHKIRNLTVVGSKKMAVLDDMAASEKIRIYDKGVELPEKYASYSESLTIRMGDIHIPYVEMKEPLRIECQQFVDSIRTGTPPPSDGRDGLRVVKILAAADYSLKNRGEPVALA